MIVVTGGAGFIGSNLIAELEVRGADEIVVCDRLGRDEKWRNIAKRELAAIVPPERLFDFLDANASRIDCLFHMGAISSTTETDGDLVVETNVALTLALWRWCVEHDKRLIYASSAATYGDGGAGFDDDGSPEALARLRPLNLYGWSKHLVDRRIARLVADGAARPRQWVGLKFFNVYGPNEYHKGAMMSIVAKNNARVALGEPVALFRSHHPDYEDGGQMRDFVYVADCVAVMLWLYDRPEVNGLFNLGTGKAARFSDLMGALFRAHGRAPELVYVDTPEEIRARYQYFTEARMDRLRAAGYDRPFADVETGVADYVARYLAQPDPYR